MQNDIVLEPYEGKLSRTVLRGESGRNTAALLDEIMENNEARTGFLAAVLKVNPKDIKETRILNPNLRKIHEDDKLGILDVRVLMNNDTEIDTEIQLAAGYLTNAEQKEEFDMLAEKSPYINSAYQHLQVISQDKDKRLEYEAREKAVRDHNQMMKEARERGLQEGRREGMREGKREGRRESIIEVAENFIRMGLETAAISIGTGLSENEIEGLRKSLR